MRFGDVSSIEKIVSAGDDMIPAPKMRKPEGVAINPNSTVYQ